MTSFILFKNLITCFFSNQLYRVLLSYIWVLALSMPFKIKCHFFTSSLFTHKHIISLVSHLIYSMWEGICANWCLHAAYEEFLSSKWTTLLNLVSVPTFFHQAGWAGTELHTGWAGFLARSPTAAWAEHPSCDLPYTRDSPAVPISSAGAPSFTLPVSILRVGKS